MSKNLENLGTELSAYRPYTTRIWKFHSFEMEYFWRWLSGPVIKIKKHLTPKKEMEQKSKYESRWDKTEQHLQDYKCFLAFFLVFVMKIQFKHSRRISFQQLHVYWIFIVLLIFHLFLLLQFPLAFHKIICFLFMFVKKKQRKIKFN
jgi:hypothetical protein